MKTLLAILFSATLCLAQGPYFSESNISILPDGTGKFTWYEKGIESQSVNYSLVPEQITEWVCTTGNVPNYQIHGQPQTYTLSGLGGFELPVYQGGIWLSYWIAPYGVANGVSCPSGQTLRTACIQYGISKIYDNTNGVSVIFQPEFLEVKFIPGVPGC